VDGVTWDDYEAELEPWLADLHGRIHRGAYRPQPSRRVYIPKADGRERPLAIAALEDKIVQGAFVMVLNAIYEEDFLGFSYGFRPGRGPHDALDALTVGFCQTRVCSRTWKRGSAEDYARIFGSSGGTGPIASKNCAVVAYQSSMQRLPPVPRRGSGACPDTRRFNKHCATTTSTRSGSLDFMFLTTPNLVEPLGA
jgi:hypothetical protein